MCVILKRLNARIKIDWTACYLAKKPVYDWSE